jgi:hypothetical protein
MTFSARITLWLAVIFMLFVVHPRVALAIHNEIQDAALARGDTLERPGAFIAPQSLSSAPAATAPARDCGRWHAVAAAALTGATAWAATRTEPASNVWLTPGAVSWHSRRTPRLNELNTGLGLELALAPAWRVAAGAYCNSEHRTSAYAALMWLPWQPHDLVRIGLAAGVASGYRHADGAHDTQRLVVRAGPIATVEWGRIGLNITGAPRVSGLDGFVALQLKVAL